MGQCREDVWKMLHWFYLKRPFPSRENWILILLKRISFVKIVFVRGLTQSLRLDSGYYIGFPVEVDGSMDLSIPTDLVEAKKKNLNWLLVLNMLGFINKNKFLTFFPVMAATQILLYHKGRAAIRHYANQPRPFWLLCLRPNFTLRDCGVNARLA